MSAAEIRELCCTGRKDVLDLKIDCNSCGAFRESMVVDSDRMKQAWVVNKPKNKEVCILYMPKYR